MLKASRWARCSRAGLLVLPLVGLAGCNGFFVKPTSGGNTVTTADVAYISNSASGPTYLAEYDVSQGKLTALSGSPINLGYTPVALAVAPSNKFLYAASAPDFRSPGIYLYGIGTSGALAAANGGSPLIVDQSSSMAISADGGWLFSLSVTGLVMNEYRVDTSTGGLTLAGSFVVPGLGCVLSSGNGIPASQTCTVSPGPSGTYVAVALGTAGTALFPFTASAGISNAAFTLIPSGSSGSAPSGDFSVTLDKNNYAYIARTNTLAVFAITSSGATAQSVATFASGTVPRSPLLGPSYNYVYTANQGVSTISGFAISSTGTLSEVSSSPFSAPQNVGALGLDNTGKYILAVGYAATSGVQLYTVGTTGTLAGAASAPSGTAITYPAVMALTH